MCWALHWIQVTQSVSSSSSLLCNTRKMARLAWTASRNGGVILSTRRRRITRECPLRAFRKGESLVHRAGKNVVPSESKTDNRVSMFIHHFPVFGVSNTIFRCYCKPCLASPYISSDVPVIIGLCSMYLGRKHVSRPPDSFTTCLCMAF